MLTVASHTMVGATLWCCSSKALSANVISVLLSNAVSHRLATSAVSEPVEIEIRKRKILTVSLTPSDYSL